MLMPALDNTPDKAQSPKAQTGLGAMEMERVKIELNSVVPEPEPPLPEPSSQQTEQLHKLGLLKIVSLVLMAAQVGGSLTLLGLTLLANQALFGLAFGVSLVALLCYAISYWLVAPTRTTQATALQAYRMASRLLIGASFTSYTFDWLLLGAQAQMSLILLVVLVLAVILLSPGEVLVLSGVMVAFGSGLELAQNFFKVYQSPIPLSQEIQGLIALAGLGLALPLIIALLLIPTRQWTKLLYERNTTLSATLTSLNSRYRANRITGHKVSTLAGQLTTTAHQQQQGSQNQLALVTQVRASVTELSATAANISTLAGQVSTTMQQVGQESKQIEATANQSAEQGEAGLRAVQQTLALSEEVASLYRDLLATMQELNEKGAAMRRVLQLNNNIATKTHLLSLNAAIEAAGAGGEYGDRFRAIAHQVKQLAAQSANASSEVSGLVGEMTSATTQASQTAMGGSVKAEQLAQVAESAGQTIAQLQAVIAQARNQASAIRAAVQSVANEQTEVIRIATSQQSSASEQVLRALEGLTEVARTSATASTSLVGSAAQLEAVAAQLGQNQGPI